jgi:hypothetical protein
MHAAIGDYVVSRPTSLDRIRHSRLSNPPGVIVRTAHFSSLMRVKAPVDFTASHNRYASRKFDPRLALTNSQEFESLLPPNNPQVIVALNRTTTSQPKG